MIVVYRKARNFYISSGVFLFLYSKVRKFGRFRFIDVKYDQKYCLTFLELMPFYAINRPELVSKIEIGKRK